MLKYNIWIHPKEWYLLMWASIIFTINGFYGLIYIMIQTGLYQCIPALMIRNCMLFLMRKGINPTWEDPKNSKGGCFSFKVNNKNVPSVWKDLSYVLTGETVSSNPKFQHNITGITISPKKSFCILKIWMHNLEYQNPRVITDIDGLTINGCIFKKHKPSY